MLSSLSSKSLSSSGTAKAIANIQKKSNNENNSSDQTQNTDAKENTNGSAIKDKVALNKVTKFKDGIVSDRIKDIGNMALKDQVEAKFPVPDTSKSSTSSSQGSPGAGSPQSQTPSPPATPNFGQGMQGQNPGGAGSFAGDGGGSQGNPWLGQPNVQTPPQHGGNNETPSLSSFANNLLKNNQIASYQLNNHNGHMDLELNGVKHGAMDSIQKFAEQRGEQLTAKCDENGCSVDLNSKNHQEQAQEVQKQQEQQSQQNAVEERNNQQPIV